MWLKSPVLAMFLFIQCALLAQVGGSGVTPSTTVVSQNNSDLAGTPPPADRLKVLYTGRLFGYLRSEECAEHDAQVDLKKKLEFNTRQCVSVPNGFENKKSKEGKPEVDKKELKYLDQDKNAVSCFFESLAQEREANPGSVLVGMGENFAPRLEARMEPDKNTSNPEQWWKPRAKNPANIGEVLGDPVGCFARMAGYDAMVPGLEDFDLGLERLRNIANVLREAPSSQGHPVKMIAANVVFSITFKKLGDPVPDDHKKDLEFDSFKSSQHFQTLSSEPFLPTLRFVDFQVSLAGDVTKEKDAKPAKRSSAFDDIRPEPVDASSDAFFQGLLGSGHVALCGPYSSLDDLSRFKTAKIDHPCGAVQAPLIYDNGAPAGWIVLTNVIAQQLDQCKKQIASASHALTLKSLVDVRVQLQGFNTACSVVSRYLKGGEIDLATPVTPSVKLRWPVDGTMSPGGPSKDFVSDKSYRFCVISQQATKGAYCQRLPIRRPFFQDAYVYRPDKVNPEKGIVIFGIVDQNLRAEMPDPQGSWWDPPDSKRKIEIETVDPQSALMQAQDAFKKDHPQFKGKKILLAQMDSHRAEDLAAGLDQPYAVDLTIAKGDGVHATSAPSSTRLSIDDAQRLPVLVPPSISNSKGKNIINPLALAEVAASPSHVWLLTSDHHKENLKFYDADSADRFIGLACPDTASMQTADPPKMLGLLRCAAKAYLFELAKKEGVLPENERARQLSSSSNTSEFTEAVLQIMRQRSKTDLAMLEKREIYGIVEARNRSNKAKAEDSEDLRSQDDRARRSTSSRKDIHADPDPNDPAFLRKFMDRILWEDSTLQKLAVTGATLKKVLKQSDAYKSQEELTTERASVLGRSLNLAGLKKGEGKEEYLINGKALEDGVQYSIATSERMLSVNSDYPDLRKDIEGETAEIDSSSLAEFISFAVCEELRQTKYLNGQDVQCAPESGRDTEQDYIRPAGRIFASRPECAGALTQMQAGWCKQKEDAKYADMIDPSRGITLRRRFLDSLGVPIGPNPLKIPAIRSGFLVSGAQLADQFQRTHRLSISELSFSAAYHQPDQTAQQLSQNFSSAVLSTVSQARSSTVDVKNTAKYLTTHYVVRGHGLDMYMSDDVAFSSQDQSQTGAFPHKITLNKNQWSAVPFALSYSFSARHNFVGKKPDRLLPELNWIFEPSRFTGQLVETDNFLTASSGIIPGQPCNGSSKNGICTVSLDVIQQRTLSWTPRSGVRLETQSNHLEIGGQVSRDWRVPLEYIFNRSSATPIPCRADQLQDCVAANANAINAQDGIKQVNIARWQVASYLDLAYKVPLHRSRKIFFVLKNKGEFFWNRGNDSQVLTKYDDTLTNSLSIPIWRNIAAEPTVELFWYENKVVFNDLFKVTYALKLNYTLDWGVRRMKFHEATKSSPFSQSASSPSQ